MAYKQAQLDGQQGIYDDEADQFYPQVELKPAKLDGQDGLYHPKSDLFIPMGEPKLTPASVGMAKEYPSGESAPTPEPSPVAVSEEQQPESPWYQGMFKQPAAYSEQKPLDGIASPDTLDVNNQPDIGSGKVMSGGPLSKMQEWDGTPVAPGMPTGVSDLKPENNGGTIVKPLVRAGVQSVGTAALLAGGIAGMNPDKRTQETLFKFYDDTRAATEKLMPDADAGFVEKFLDGAIGIAPYLATGGPGAVSILANSAARGADAVRQGIDPDTATALGIKDLATTAAMFKAPFGGESIVGGAARGAGINMGIDIADKALEKGILTAADYDELASKVKVFDPESLGQAAAIGAVFGIKDSTGRTTMPAWYYGLTNKERALVPLTIADLEASGWTDARLARMNPEYFKQALAERMNSEQPATKQPTPPVDPTTTAFNSAISELKKMAGEPEEVPVPPVSAQATRPPVGAMAPEGSTMPTEPAEALKTPPVQSAQNDIEVTNNVTQPKYDLDEEFRQGDRRQSVNELFKPDRRSAERRAPMTAGSVDALAQADPNLLNQMADVGQFGARPKTGTFPMPEAPEEATASAETPAEQPHWSEKHFTKQPLAEGATVRAGGSPEVRTIVSVLEPTATEKELGEQYFEVKNSKGVVEVFEKSDLKPIKTGKKAVVSTPKTEAAIPITHTIHAVIESGSKEITPEEVKSLYEVKKGQMTPELAKADLEAQGVRVVGEKKKPLNMAGETRPERTPSVAVPDFIALHPKSQEKFNTAWETKNNEEMRKLLDPMNKGLRAEFEKRTGEKLPKTINGTKAIVEKWSSSSPAAPPVENIKAPSKDELKSNPDVLWHGSPSGDLRGSAYGLHIGTHEAARQALNARIGIPAEGEWDGTREYGKTLLAGQKTLKAKGEYPTGHSVDAPSEDYYPEEKAYYSDQTKVSLTSKPDIFPVKIKGKMSNTNTSPHEDFKANGYMKAALKKKTAKSGYYYKNVGEDEGSISAVVPSASHIEKVAFSEPATLPSVETAPPSEKIQSLMVKKVSDILSKIDSIKTRDETATIDKSISREIYDELKRYDSNLAYHLMKKADEGLNAALALNTGYKGNKDIGYKGQVDALKSALNRAHDLLKKEDANNQRISEELGNAPSEKAGAASKRTPWGYKWEGLGKFKVKEPWQVTKKEFDDNFSPAISEPIGETIAKSTHKDLVTQAIREGKVVSERVLKDYPDLQKQGGLFDKMKDAYKRSSLSSEGGSVGEKTVAPAFYSKAESLVKQFLPDKSSPQAVLDLMKQHKVKADDLTHSGIEDFVAEVNNRNAKVNKSDLLAFMQEKQAKIVSVEFWDTPLRSRVKALEAEQDKIRNNAPVGRYGHPFYDAETLTRMDEISRELSELKKDREAYAVNSRHDIEPKFSNWKIPGESIPGSYVEHFETVDEKPSLRIEKTPEGYVVREKDGAFLDMAPTQEEAEKLKAQYLEYPDELSAGWRDGHAPYDSVKNPIVRWRGDGRLDTQGHKTFFIHEIQAPSAENQAKMPDWARKRWREIGLKSALDYAVKNGYDSLSLASGEQVAGLYDLSKQVDKLQYSKDGGWLLGIKDGHPLIVEQGVSPEKLQDFVGKDAAKKLLSEQEKNLGGGFARRPFGHQGTELSGLDLKVGAGGLKTLYDRDLPGILNDLGKKFGVKVGEATLPVDEARYIVYDRNGDAYASRMNEADAKRDVAAIGGSYKMQGMGKNVSLAIPPSIKSDVTYKGQELYSFPAGIIKALKPLVRDAKAAYPHLEKLAEGVYNEGHTKFFEFKAQMKKLLGDMWDAFKHLMEKLYFAAKKWNGKLGERGAVGEPSPIQQYLAKVEQAIREGKTLSPRTIVSYKRHGGKMLDEAKPVESRGKGEEKTTINKAAEEAAATLKDFIDKTPKAGLSIANVAMRKSANDNVNIPGIDTLESVNPDAELRWKKSKGITQQGLLAKIKEHSANLWELRKAFPGLDYKEDAKVINILREYSAVPEYSKHLSAETTAGILAGLGPKKYDIFTRNVVLPDIIRDIDSGLLSEDRLPFGYKSKSEVQKDLDKFSKIADVNPDIKAALARREAFHKALTTELVNQELLPKEILDDPRYFHHQVLQYMEVKKAYPGTSSKDVREHKKGFQKGRKGSSLDYNTEYIESEFEYVAQALGQIKTKEIVDRIGKATDISSQVKADAKAQGLKDWHKAIPEGYTTWQPKPGTQWYKALSVPQRVIDEVLSGTRELTPEDLREVIAMAGKKQEWVVPERVAKVLDNFRDFSKDEGFDRFVRATMATWKQWVLMNPARVLKYNINNMSGDLDIALAYDPRILKYFKEAAGEAWDSKKGAAMSRDMREAVEYGVISSGFTIQEIPDIKDIGLFRVLTGNESNIIARYWEQTKELTQMRENILRIAAYKYFKAEIAAGKKNYGASKRELVDAETDPKRKAAMLARDLIGDYGNISQAGQWLRQRMIPFWSWMEINAPRYLRLIRNASYEGKSTSGAAGKVAGKVGARAAFKTAKVILQANILYAAAMAWNAAMEIMLDMDDDEKRALYEDRKQMHIILGRTEDGHIRTLRIQGALSDALDWMALGDWPDVVKDMVSEKTTISNQAKEMGKAPINRIINASHPMLKSAGEVITGKQIYPDVFNARPIRDKAEHVTRMFSLDMPYRYLTGKPTRGAGNDVMELVTYTNDPGERSYWMARKAAYDFLEKGGKEIPSADPTSRSNALYYYKQAKRYGDTDAQEKYIKEYVNLGGTLNGLWDSAKRGGPLGSLSQRDRWEYMKTVSPEDKRQLELAEKWYRTHMKINESDMKNIMNLMRERRTR